MVAHHCIVAVWFGCLPWLKFFLQSLVVDLSSVCCTALQVLEMVVVQPPPHWWLAAYTSGYVDSSFEFQNTKIQNGSLS